MGRGLEWVDDARAAAPAQIDEPIVTVGFLQPGGSGGPFEVGDRLATVARDELEVTLDDDLRAELAPTAADG